MQRNGLITNWYPLKIGAGEEWQREINKHLNTARIILLLISSDFLASDSIYEVQIPRAIKRHFDREARVIPILLREVAGWENTYFGKIQLGQLQPLPKNKKFVTSSAWKNLDEAFADVANGIKEAVEELNTKH